MSLSQELLVRTVVIHRSLHRHTLVLGAERELVMSSALISFILVVVGKDLISAGAALLFWLTSVILLRMMAKEDPQMSQVWLRRNAYQTVYPAKSTPWRR
ncbi:MULTISPECIES: conjugal transfer protein TrbD [unclassified Maridesulfovibrio]|uniref:conjugal transfer protein TrbD n=1 Tax=unclassified Maridesulfovibrio TaxID=2794999 RepID=UPI003B411503